MKINLTLCDSLTLYKSGALYMKRALVTLSLCLSFALSNSANAERARIISAGGSITEILFELGMGDDIVAVDTSSFYPYEASKLPKVGYFRSLGAEGLLSLNPDTLIAAKGAGPQTVLDQVASLGVEVKTYQQATYTFDAWKELINELGDDYSKQDEARALINRVSENLDINIAKRNFEDQGVNAIALLSIGQRGPVAAGQNTVPSLLFKLAGIKNIAHELDGYKPFSAELLAKKSVDVVFLPSHVVDGLGGVDAVCENQLLKLAMPEECRVEVIDGLLLMGFGARLDQAVGQIVNLANAL